MAIYDLTVSIGSRSGGHSASAKDEYIEREGRYEEDASELEHSESGNMPEWAEEDSHAYWEAADEHERVNGRLYREVEFALPNELDEGERRELALDFAQSLTVKERLPYTLAIHRGLSDKPEKPDNPHCHLMISERMNDGMDRTPETWFKRYNRANPEKGGALKSRSCLPVEWLENTRKSWAEHANRALERAGSAERIDQRTLAERAEEAQEAGDLEKAAGLSREPNVHVGPGPAIEARYWRGMAGAGSGPRLSRRPARFRTGTTNGGRNGRGWSGPKAGCEATSNGCGGRWRASRPSSRSWAAGWRSW